MPSLLQSGKVTVTLHDVNGQKVESKDFSPGSYGTFAGEFNAPEGKLLGNMQLEATGIATGSVSVQVEEYKRPTFEVLIDPASQAFKLNAPVTVTGKAMTYAGVPSDNSKVQYRVVRRTHFPWFPWWRKIWIPDSPQMVITQGTTTTDASGAFTITFDARGDRSVANQKPEYAFEIIADVTDVAGETRSATKEVILANHSFRANVAITDKTEIETLSQVSISATNLNGEDVTLTGTVKVPLSVARRKPGVKLHARIPWTISPLVSTRS
jgi:uncharacterized protein YfaS (alpha-2-macroglobulin family)